jgi:hypothetical protein
MTSVKPVGTGGSSSSSSAVVDDDDDDDEDQILPPQAGEEVAPRRSSPPRGQNRAAVSASWADREAPDYGASSGGKGGSGGWRADEEEWDDAAEDGVQLGAEMEAEVSEPLWMWMVALIGESNDIPSPIPTTTPPIR